jgi:hypothetical protein
MGCLVASWPLAAQPYTASPITAGSYTTYPYNFTGMLTMPNSQGSGAVVKNPRVVYSCAHLVFDTSAVDPWLSGVRWYRAWASGSWPSSNGQPLRSYYYIVGYASSALKDKSSNGSYSQDFVVHYAYENTANGGFAGSWEDGVSQLKLGSTKLITGYPSGIYKSQPGDSRTYLMHQTGPFNNPLPVISDDFLQLSEVSAGPGNSGGPVWVSDGAQYYFAGVVVSGRQRSIGDSDDIVGVYGVDSSSASLIDAAIAASSATVAAPLITSQPTSRRVNAGQSVSFTVTAFGTGLGYRWLFNNAVISSATSATLSLNSVSLTDAGTYQALVSNTGGEVRSTIVTLSVDSPPIIVSQPVTKTVVVGASATFSVSTQSAVTVTYQWRKDGVAINGATNATLALSNVQNASAGSYTVVVTNSIGSVTSNAALLTVNPPLAITAQPRSQNLTHGSNLVLSVGSTGGAGSLTYQWRFNGATLLNGTSSTYTANNIGFGFSGMFDVVVSDGASTVTSVPAVITVVPVSRISNLSILTNITTSSPLFTVGTVVGGAGTSGSKSLLVRAAGPSLTQLGVTGVLQDPNLDLLSGQNVVAANNDWGGTAALGAAFLQVGAFAYSSAASKDAAIYNTALPAGAYTMRVGGIGGATGSVIAELYDATPSTAFTASTPRLINVSVLKQINAGEILTAGFVIVGTASKQVLVRAVGPGLAPFFVNGAMIDPRLDLFSGQTVINSNNDWASGATIALLTAFTNVGAFGLSVDSRDAALLVTLQPGNYTAQVSGVGGSGGVVLVEVYEVP